MGLSFAAGAVAFYKGYKDKTKSGFMAVGATLIVCSYVGVVAGLPLVFFMFFFWVMYKLPLYPVHRSNGY